MILRALAATRGSAIYRDEDGEVDLTQVPTSELKPYRKKLQMVFQDPFSSLNPRMTVEDLIGEPLLIHGERSRSKRRERVAELLEAVGLNASQMQRYPHAFSGGQRQRIGIARALILRPRVIVADEAVSALDVSVQAQVINLLQDLQEKFQLTYIFVAHDLSVVKHICYRVAVMYAGRIVELAPTEQLFERPHHPYTQALLKAVPSPDPDDRQIFAPMGEIADPGNLPPGCSFNPRCPHARERCSAERPSLAQKQPRQVSACFLNHEGEWDIDNSGSNISQ